MNELRKDRPKVAQANTDTDGDHAHNDLARMAADPDIQREIATINAELAVTEMDGLNEPRSLTATPNCLGL